MSYHRHIFHLVTRTKNRQPTIPEENKRVMLAYILKMCQGRGWYLYRINTYRNHLHILIELPASSNPDEVMRYIKSQTSRVFHRHESFPHFIGWGEGYASFTVSFSDVDKIKRYIANQSEHHKVESWDDEIKRLLLENGWEQEALSQAECPPTPIGTVGQAPRLQEVGSSGAATHPEPTSTVGQAPRLQEVGSYRATRHSTSIDPLLTPNIQS